MAIYQSKFLSPYNTTIDGTIINPFSFTCQGSTITKYNAKAYRVSDNVQVYTTGDVVLSPVKYNNDVVTFDVPALTFTNGTQYKWEVITYENASFATSFQVTFWANATATLTMTVPATITSQRYTFTATYTQANGVPIQYFYFILSSGGQEITRTDLTFSGNISHTFEGFINGNNYSVVVTGVTNNGATVTSPTYNFLSEYSQPSVLIQPDLLQDCNTSLVTIDWDNIIQVLGTSSGTPNYVDGLSQDGGKALQLDTGEFVEWTFDIPIEFTCQFMLQIPYPTNDIKVQLKTGYYFGYEDGKFYVDVNGDKQYSLPYSIDQKVFFIVLRPNGMYIDEFELNWTWDAYRTQTWADVFNKGTWEDVLRRY